MDSPVGSCVCVLESSIAFLWAQYECPMDFLSKPADVLLISHEFPMEANWFCYVYSIDFLWISLWNPVCMGSFNLVLISYGSNMNSLWVPGGSLLISYCFPMQSQWKPVSLLSTSCWSPMDSLWKPIEFTMGILLIFYRFHKGVLFVFYDSRF
jgi:hypothetical protein